MSAVQTSIVLVGTTESAGSLISSQPRGLLKGVRVKRNAGSGTQWRVRFFLGYTADKKHLLLTSVDLPAVANDFVIATQASSYPTTSVSWNFDSSGNEADLWDSGDLRAGAGIYVTLEQLAGSGNDTVEVRPEIGRDRG